MEKAIVMGCACIVVSSLTPEQIENAKQYAPETLILTDEKGEELYRLDLESKTPGCVEEDHAVYSDCTTADGKATITIIVDPSEENKKQMILNNLGASLLKLDQLEKSLMARLDQILKKKDQAGELVVALSAQDIPKEDLPF